MPIDQDVSKILKEMWRLDEKLTSGIALDSAEKDFYNNNLETIVGYYEKNNSHWSSKKKLD